MTMEKSFAVSFLVFVIICGFIITGNVNFGEAQTPTATPNQQKFQISGYILDSAGHGISGVNVIFNLPDIVPSVFSDSSGHYSISAPAGIYHINVWPPTDSNYIFHDEPGYAVISDMTKNITLNSGYKVSGYIFDSQGTPIKNAIVSLNGYLSGWFSTSQGFYFVSAPAGTYKLTVAPRNGYNHFTKYSENNFVLKGDIARNITIPTSVVTPSPTPTPTLTPTPTPTPIPNQNRFQISGYILDSNGQGVGGAMLIFSVPDLIPSVYSDSSGRYNISAPAGTYHIAVWPPFDSNYISYDEPNFVVTLNATKNITLPTGVKVSGYVTDPSGKPVKQAIVRLSNYFSGYPSNAQGYFFVSAPAGTYRFSVEPRIGYDFPSYFESNFVVNANTVKNVTISGPKTSNPTPTYSPTQTPSPTQHPTPTPTQTPPLSPTASPSSPPSASSSSVTEAPANSTDSLSASNNIASDQVVLNIARESIAEVNVSESGISLWIVAVVAIVVVAVMGAGCIVWRLKRKQ
jgi:protocatechuate 3,4-dioxygenase beta subunit